MSVAGEGNAWTGGQYSVFRVLFGAYLFVHFAHEAICDLFAASHPAAGQVPQAVRTAQQQDLAAKADHSLCTDVEGLRGSRCNQVHRRFHDSTPQVMVSQHG